MSYALGLGARPPASGRRSLALSGFVPTVDGFELDLDAPLPRFAIGHGTYDPVIGVEWGRPAKALLEEAGAELSTANTRSRTRSIHGSCSRRATTSWIGFEQRVHDVVARDAVLLDPRPQHSLAAEAGLLGDALRCAVLDVRVELQPPVAVRERPLGHERERARTDPATAGVRPDP